jgi:Right handed beta helix region
MKLFNRIAWLLVLSGLLFGFAGCEEDDGPSSSNSGRTGTSISSSLTTDLTLSQSPYVVSNNVNVPSDASINIEAGVEIYFEEAPIGVEAYTFDVEGKITAIGSESNFILFSSNNNYPDRGDWGGVHLLGADDDSRLEFVRVAYASKYDIIADTTRHGENRHMITLLRGAITVRNCSPTIERCIIEKGGYDGIQLIGNCEAQIRANTIVMNAFNAIRIEPDYDALVIDPGTTVGVSTIAMNNITDNDDAGIRVPSDYKNYVELFPVMSYNNFYGNAAFAYVPPGWQNFEGERGLLNISVAPMYVDIDGGDYHLDPCSALIDAGDPGNGDDPDGTIMDIGVFSLYQSATDLSKRLFGTKLRLTEPEYHFICDAYVAEDDTLVIDAGTVLRFDGYYGLTVNGHIMVNGTLGNEVVFTGVEGSTERGQWRQLLLVGVDEGSSINHTIIQYASNENLEKPIDRLLYTGAISLVRSSLTLQNVAILDSYYDGLFCYDGSNPTLDKIIIDNSGYNGFVCKLNCNPTFTRSIIRGAQAYGIDISINSNPDISNVLIYDVNVLGVNIFNSCNPTFDQITLYGKSEWSGDYTRYVEYGFRIETNSIVSIRNSIVAEFASAGAFARISSGTSHVGWASFSSSISDENIVGLEIYDDPDNEIIGDPGFENAADGDFHIRTDGAAKGASETDSEIGAYGGANPLGS